MSTVVHQASRTVAVLLSRPILRLAWSAFSIHQSCRIDSGSKNWWYQRDGGDTGMFTFTPTRWNSIRSLCFQHAMDIMGLTKDIQRSIFSLLAGILHLGNVQFGDKNNYATVLSERGRTLSLSCFNDDRRLLSIQICKLLATTLVFKLRFWRRSSSPNAWSSRNIKRINKSIRLSLSTKRYLLAMLWPNRSIHVYSITSFKYDCLPTLFISFYRWEQSSRRSMPPFKRPRDQI